MENREKHLQRGYIHKENKKARQYVKCVKQEKEKVGKNDEKKKKIKEGRRVKISKRKERPERKREKEIRQRGLK